MGKGLKEKDLKKAKDGLKERVELIPSVTYMSLGMRLMTGGEGGMLQRVAVSTPYLFPTYSCKHYYNTDTP